MLRLNVVLILNFVFAIETFSQVTKFIWSENTMGYTNEVHVERMDSKCYLQIVNNQSGIVIRQKIEHADCNSLFRFLDTYEFKKLGNIYKDTVRTYYKTEFLKDSLHAITNGDTVRLELMPVKGYFFDKTLRKCYKESINVKAWTDGTTYKGEYITPANMKQYSIYCKRLTQQDFLLNQLIEDLILKYDKKGDFKKLIITIESDKPNEIK